MRRVTAFFLSVLTLCVLTLPAAADVIWEPQDSFYESHSAECTYEGRSYYVNSKEGAAALYGEPGGTKAEILAANGVMLSVGFTYKKDGEVWGVAEYDAADGQNWLSWETGHETGSGWIRLSDLLLIYDEQSFEEEYGKEFTDYSGGFDALLASDDQRVIVWTYPGSGTSADDFAHLDSGYAGKMEIDRQWTDGDGRVWGHVAYYMGARGWVCLSDPGNEALPVTEHSRSLYPAAHGAAGTGSASSAEAVPAQTGDSSLNTGLILGVAAVCGITGVLLFSMRRRKPD